MLRHTRFLLLSLILSLPLNQAQAANLTGRWTTTEGAIVQISKCGASYCGHLRSFTPPEGLKQTQVRDQKNSDKSKRTRPVLGMKVLWNLKKTGDNTWVGQGYEPRRGINATMHVTQVSPNQLQMKGCKKLLFNLCENFKWDRQL